MTDLQYRLNPKIVFREEEGESLLFDPDTGRVKILNETGTLIYELLTQKLSREKIVDSITSEYDNMNRQDLEQDLDEFAAQMEQSGILTVIT
jgi:hypothetical protein